MRHGIDPAMAASDQIAAPASSGDTAINARAAFSNERWPKLGQKNRLQSHLWLGWVKVGVGNGFQ